MQPSYTSREQAGPLYRAARVSKRILVVLFAASLYGQDPPTTGFENQGSATFGYRFTDVRGYRPKFEELLNLRSGPRFSDFNLFGQARGKDNRLADSYSLTAYGLGGDPFTTMQFTAKKRDAYSLRADFQRSYYSWNRNDSTPLTNAHNWSTVRRIASIQLQIHATKNLRFTLEYMRNTRDGVSDTTRSLDYFGAPSTWGSFARANPFYVVAPFAESSNRGTAGVDYTRGDWALHYRLGYQRFQDRIDGFNPNSPQRSLNIDDAATAREPLNSLSWRDFRKLSTPVSEFSYSGRVLDRLSLRGGYIFYRYSGPATIDMAFAGTARTNSAGTTTAPYNISLSNSAQVTEPNHVVDQGINLDIKPWWSATADYRDTRFTVDSQAQFRSLVGGAATTGTATSQWRVGTNTLDLGFLFTPAPSLLIRTSIRLMKSDVVASDNGIVDASRTKRIRTVWPHLSVYYRPSKIFSVRGDIEQTVNGASYTRVTPHVDIGGRILTRIQPLQKLSLENTLIVRNRRLIDTGYRNTVRSNASMISYQVRKDLTFFGGFSYDSYFAYNFVNFLRGAAPFTNLALRDQTVNRLWQGGLRANVYKGLGVSFSGNYLRTTGLGEIAGEIPLYGPMRFPYATGSVWYDIPRVGKFNAQIQRAYYTEQIFSGNNFSANSLMLSMTRSFGK